MRRALRVNNIEVIIVLLLLFTAVPDLCRKLRRPALAYSVFVLFGCLLGSVATMLRQAGQVGFLLLLEVGLEIDPSELGEFLPALKRAAHGSLSQYPVAMLLAWPEYCKAPGAATWLLLTGLFGTVPSILFLPAESPQGPNYPSRPQTGSRSNSLEPPALADKTKNC